jgi:RHS repeat-associated protein
MSTKHDEAIDLEEPLRGVVVLAREDFEANLRRAFGRDDPRTARRRGGRPATGFRVDDETALRATELAGRANEPDAIGIVALIDGRSSGAFSGNLFVVADTVDLDTDGGRLVVTDFDIVAVELAGTAAWVGGDARLARGPTPSGLPGVSQPGRCCGPTTICIPGGPQPDPSDPIFRYSLGERMAVVRAPSGPKPPGQRSTAPVGAGPDTLPGRGDGVDNIPGQPPIARVGDYRTRQDEGRSPVRSLLLDTYSLGNKTLPAGVRWPSGVPTPQILDCVRVVDKSCNVVTPVCEPGMIGFTDNNDREVSIAVGSNPCGGAAGSRPLPLREVPEWCTYIFAPETLPSACGGVSDTLNMPWASRHTLPKFCGVAKVAPGSIGPCNPVSEALRNFERQRAAGWSLGGGAVTRCESLGPGFGGAEHCVSCNAAGECYETLVRPKIDPTIIDDAQQAVEEPTSPPAQSIDPLAAALAWLPPRIPLTHKSPAPEAPAETAPPAPGGTDGTGPKPPRELQPGLDANNLVNGRPGQVADPVDLSDGAYRIDHTDLQFPGPVRPLSLTRTYSSSSRNRSSMGSNWMHSWDERLEPLTPDLAPAWLSSWCAGSPSLTTAVLHHRGDGGAELFLLDASTTLFLPQAGCVSTLARVGTGWAMRDPDGRIRSFDSDGYLTSDTDRFGNLFTVAYEPTPLGRLFAWHCAPERLVARNETLYHRRNALLAYLVGAIPRPGADRGEWEVTAADFAPPHDPLHPDADSSEQLTYARDLLLYLCSLGPLPESSDGCRRKRVTSVTDPLGRELRFIYAGATTWNPAAPDPAAFASHPAQGMVERVIGPGGTSVSYSYGRPTSYPVGLNEVFLVRSERRDAATTDSGLVASQPSDYQFEYCWPGGNFQTYEPFAGSVATRYEAYFRTFVGCGYAEPVSCIGEPAVNLPRFNPGSPTDLARRASEAYVSDVADNIVTVLRNGRTECETRYPVDPTHPAHGRVVAQRYGSSTSTGAIGTVPPDEAWQQWKTALPKAALQWVDSGPSALAADGTALNERTESALPEAIRTRYPLEPRPSPAVPLARANPPAAGECDLNAMADREAELPGWRPVVAYYDAPAPAPPRRPAFGRSPAVATDLRRTWLTRDQLVNAQVSDPTHNDLMVSPTPDPANPLLVFFTRIVGRRRQTAANANRICGWARVTNRDGLVQWHGVNYRGQVLVLAEANFDGRFRFSEWRYNADGLVVEHRPPAPEHQRSPHTTTWTYDEIDPTAERGWAEWLPAFWARRQNTLRIEHRLEGRAVSDLESGRPSAGTNAPDFETTAGSYTRIVWEPLFNQPSLVEEGTIRDVSRWWITRLQDQPHRRLHVLYDYQELSLASPDSDPSSIGGLLEALRPWGFAWVRADSEAMAWQLPVPLLDQDVNGDGQRGNRFAAAVPAGAPALDPGVVAARRGVGSAVAVIESRAGVASTARRWLISRSPHGLPGRVEGPDGDILLHDYFELAAPYGVPGQVPPAAQINAGNRGMLARQTLRLQRPGWPTEGPATTPNEAMSGPYQWLPIAPLPAATPRAQVEAALRGLALPAEMVADIVATTSDDPTVVPAAARLVTNYAYNVAGHRIGAIDAVGARAWTTDTDGRIVTQVDPQGVISTIDWDAFGNAVAGHTKGVASIAAEWIARYDEEGRLVFRSDGLDAGGLVNPAPGHALARSWAFLPEGAPSASTDAEGLITRFEYDGWGRSILETRQRAGSFERRTLERSWDIENRLTAVTLGGPAAPGLPNSSESWAYDALGRVSRHTDHRGTTWWFAWSSRGLMTRRALASAAYGQTSVVRWEEITQFDDHARPTSVTVVGAAAAPAPPPITEVARSTWSRGGSLVTTTTAGLGATMLVHDLAGRVAWERRPDGIEIVRSWSENPNRAGVAELRVDASGTRRCVATITSYDSRGLPTSITRTAADAGQLMPAHRITEQRQYDTMGRLVIEIGPLGERTEHVLDWGGRATERRVERSPGGPIDVTTMVWDGRDDLLGVTDPNGQILGLTRDNFGAVQESTLSSTPTVRQVVGRDRLGRVVTLDDGISRLRRTWSDGTAGPAGDPVLDELETPAGWAPLARRDFDEHGRLSSIDATNPALDWLPEPQRTVQTQRRYDQIGRIVEEQTTVGGTASVQITTAWSPRPGGGWERQWGATTTGWFKSGMDVIDGGGRLLSRSMGGAAITFQWEGQLYAGRRQPQTGWAAPLTETITLDPFGLPRAAELRAIELDPAGVPLDAADAARLAPPGSDQSLLASRLLRQAFDRDRVGRVVSWWWQSAHPAAGAVSRWRGARYDQQRRLQGVWDDDTAAAAPTLPPYEADLATIGALAQVDTTEWAYSRDPASGDLLRIADQLGNERFELTGPHRPGHQVPGLTVGGTTSTISHDAAGRVRAVSGTPADMTLRWHPTGELASVAVGGTAVESYLYDGMGRLVGVAGRGQQGIQQRHVFDGAHIIAGLASDGSARWEATWGPASADQLLEFSNRSTGETSVPLLDLNGSPLAVWSPVAAALTGLVRWSPEGQGTISGPSGLVRCEEMDTWNACPMPGGIEFGFVGAWRSPRTGFTWMRARWYSPVLAQFLSQDPAGFIDGTNLYAYAAGDPLNRVDPLGLGSAGPARPSGSHAGGYSSGGKAGGTGGSSGELPQEGDRNIDDDRLRVPDFILLDRLRNHGVHSRDFFSPKHTPWPDFTGLSYQPPIPSVRRRRLPPPPQPPRINVEFDDAQGLTTETERDKLAREKKRIYVLRDNALGEVESEAAGIVPGGSVIYDLFNGNLPGAWENYVEDQVGSPPYDAWKLHEAMIKAGDLVKQARDLELKEYRNRSQSGDQDARYPLFLGPQWLAPGGRKYELGPGGKLLKDGKPTP